MGASVQYNCSTNVTLVVSRRLNSLLILELHFPKHLSKQIQSLEDTLFRLSQVSS